MDRSEDKLMAFGRETGKTPALVKKEEDGFIVNNVLKRRYEETGVKSYGFDMISKLYEEGRLGKKTKHGFYDYE